MRGDSAVQSGVKLFPLSFTIAPFAIIVGASVTITGHYVAQNLLGWAFATVGAGLYTLLEYDSGPASWAGLWVYVFLSRYCSGMPSKPTLVLPHGVC